MTIMTMGANVPLAATAVRAVLTWRPGQGTPPVDAAALLLGADGRVHSDDDMVFYNQSVHPDGAVTHLRAGPGSDTLRVDLARLDARVQRVVLAASADGEPLGRVPALRLDLMDDPGGALLARFPMAATTETAFVGGELYRRGDGWRFRAVGQGYDSGLAGLATDFGITVDEEPAPLPAVPGPLPVDLHKRLELRKHAVAVSLQKHGGAGLRARVVLVLDASGSMSRAYRTGVVGRVVERMAAVALQLDDDGELEAWTFATNPARLPDLTPTTLPEWIRLHVRVGEFRLWKRPPVLEPGQVDMARVGGANDEPKVIAQVRAHVRHEPVADPTLVLFFSDGGVTRSREIERELLAAVDEPIFWQFVGLGRRAGYGVLERLDTMRGRRVDNVGFFAVDDIDDLPDATLYDRLLAEFPSWVTAARQAGVLR